jgi:hypothetical protein
MTTSRERTIAALNHQPVDRAPRDLWTLPGTQSFRGDEVQEMEFRYPGDISPADFEYPRGQMARGTACELGEYTDAWGCTWRVSQAGMIGEVKRPPLADAAKIAAYRPPEEFLQGFDFSRVNRSCAGTSRFVLAWTQTRPFERLQFLRGTEAAFIDLATGDRKIRDLLDRLHDFFCREMELWAASDVDGVEFMDDWGSQQALLISPETWRDLFKPLYRDYCDILHRHDKFAFFHSDGNISDIFHDLVEIGVDAVNSQLFCMDLESLARCFRGQITFWGEIDRQHVLPFGAREDVREAVRRVRRLLDFGSGGLIAQCEWGLNVPFANVDSVFDEWLQPLPMHV